MESDVKFAYKADSISIFTLAGDDKNPARFGRKPHLKHVPAQNAQHGRNKMICPLLKKKTFIFM